MKFTFLPVILVACSQLVADPVMHKFSVWDIGSDGEKLNLYIGWTNGFLHGRGPEILPLLSCLEEMTTVQAVAMVNKYYKDHPEKWSSPLTLQILEALTVRGGPCENKNPFVPAKR